MAERSRSSFAFARLRCMALLTHENSTRSTSGCLNRGQDRRRDLEPSSGLIG